MLNKFRDWLTDGLEAVMERVFDRYDHQLTAIEYHYPLYAMGALVLMGMMFLGSAIAHPETFPLWLGLALCGVNLTAALWVSSKTTEYRASLVPARSHGEPRPPMPW